MLEWAVYILGFVLFFASHSIPTRPAIKARIVAVTGPVGFTIGYSLLSIGALAMLILVARQAPHVTLWDWAAWQNHVVLFAMLISFGIGALALGRPNPLSFGGWGHERFDPQNSGLSGWLRHPLLVALLIWSGAHLLPNGDLAHVIMFGVFALFSLLGMRLIDRRRKRQFGAEEWSRLASTDRHINPSLNGVFRLAAAVLLYCLVLWAHTPVIGVSPLP